MIILKALTLVAQQTRGRPVRCLMPGRPPPPRAFQVSRLAIRVRVVAGRPLRVTNLNLKEARDSEAAAAPSCRQTWAAREASRSERLGL